MKVKYGLLISLILISSCKLFNPIFAKADRQNANDLIKQKTITVSIQEAPTISEGRENIRDRISEPNKVISVKTAWEKAILTAFRKAFPDKEILFVKQGGDFIIFTKYRLEKYKILLWVGLTNNPRKIKTNSYNPMNLLSIIEFDCKISQFHGDWKTAVKLYYQEWRPESVANEVNEWLEIILIQGNL